MPRQSRSAMSFSAELQPGEERAIDLEMVNDFRAERVAFAPRPQTKWQRAGAAVLHALTLPWLLGRTFGAIRAALRPRPPEPWRDEDDAPAPTRGAELRAALGKIWRVPWPAPPIDLINIHVASRPQLPGMGPVPAEMFSELAVGALSFEAARPGQMLTIVVRCTGREPYMVRGCVIGTAFVS